MLGLGNVACPATGDCVVSAQVGSSAKSVAATLTEVNGTWGKPVELPGATSLPKVAGAGTDWISCASVGNCTLTGGYYWDDGQPIAATSPFVADESGGNWEAAEVPPGLAALNTGDYSGAAGLSCSAAASCVTAGYYTTKAGPALPFAAIETPLTSTTTALTLSATKITYGHEQSERASVTVNAAAGTPTGKATVTDGRTIACTITLSAGKGSCTLAKSVLKAGAYHITAAYAGSADLDASTSASKALTVVK